MLGHSSAGAVTLADIEVALYHSPSADEVKCLDRFATVRGKSLGAASIMSQLIRASAAETGVLLGAHPEVTAKQLGIALFHADAGKTAILLAHTNAKDIRACDIGIALCDADLQTTQQLLKHAAKHKKIINGDYLGVALWGANAEKARELFQHRHADDITGDHLGIALEYADVDKTCQIFTHHNRRSIAPWQLGAALIGAEAEKIAIVLSHFNAVRIPIEDFDRAMEGGTVTPEVRESLDIHRTQSAAVASVSAMDSPDALVAAGVVNAGRVRGVRHTVLME